MNSNLVIYFLLLNFLIVVIQILLYIEIKGLKKTHISKCIDIAEKDGFIDTYTYETKPKNRKKSRNYMKNKLRELENKREVAKY